MTRAHANSEPRPCLLWGTAEHGCAHSPSNPASLAPIGIIAADAVRIFRPQFNSPPSHRFLQHHLQPTLSKLPSIASRPRIEQNPLKTHLYSAV